MFALYEGGANSEWSSSTCGPPQGTKLAAIVFLSVINFLIADYYDCYKFVDDLSFILKYLVQNIVTPQFSSNFFSVFTKECAELNLEINVNKSRIVCFNPLKSNVMVPNVPFFLTNSIKILGVTFSNDFSFTAHIENVVKSANASLQTLNSMHRFSANTESIQYAYIVYVCPSLEYACPQHLEQYIFVRSLNWFRSKQYQSSCAAMTSPTKRFWKC